MAGEAARGGGTGGDHAGERFMSTVFNVVFFPSNFVFFLNSAKSAGDRSAV